MQTYFGGTWEKLGDGYFIEAGSSITTRSAGLPNITGYAGWEKNGYNQKTTVSGCFSLSTAATGYAESGGSSGSNSNTKVSFDANNGASTKGIYGNSTTVQPKSRTAYIYYRTA